MMKTIVEICKFAVAVLIAEYEALSPYGLPEHRLWEFNAFDVKDKWTTKLFHSLNTNVTKNEIDELFNSVKISTFNYDRLVEQALTTSVTNFCRDSAAQAMDSIRKLEVIRVYGSLGSIIHGHEDYRPFGYFDTDSQLAMNQIRTFHESVASDVSGQITEMVKWSKRIFVLGFSYADMNTSLLRRCCEQMEGIRPVYSSCYKMSDQNVDIARANMDNIFGNGNSVCRMLNVTCEKFFDDLALFI